MRYKGIEEVAGKYGLMVDLDEKAQLSEWESRLKKLLESKHKGLPNAKNPSLRHKLDRECAEVQDAFKFVCQQNVFSRLRKWVDEDKQEIFEHELKKPESRSNLPSESDAEYEQYLEIKAAARKKWQNNSFQATASNSSPSLPTFAKSTMGGMVTTFPLSGEEKTVESGSPSASPQVAGTIAQTNSIATELGRGASAAAAVSVDLPNTTLARPPEIVAAALATDRTKPDTVAVQTELPSSSSAQMPTEPVAFSVPTGETTENGDKTLPVIVQATVPSETPAVAAGVSELSRTAASSAAAIGQPGNGQPTETTTSTPDRGKQRAKIPIKREHVSAALDLLVKIRALIGLGGSFTILKIVATALAVFLIAVAGLITEMTRERSRQRNGEDNNGKPPTHEESRVIPAGLSLLGPDKPTADVTKQSDNTAKQTDDLAKQTAETVKPTSEAAKPVIDNSNTPAQIEQETNAPVLVANTPEPIAKEANPSGLVAKEANTAELVAKDTNTPGLVANAPAPKETNKSVPVAKETDTPVLIAKQNVPAPPEPLQTGTAPPPNIETGTARPKVQLALLRIESTPPNASISIRGTKQPLKTPAEFNLMPGDYDVALALDCYSSVSTILHLESGDTRVMSRELQSLQPVLTVRTAPSGAKIYVDGAIQKQLTPATVAGIDAGDRWVTVELAGYRAQNMAVKAKCGETVAADFGTLQRQMARLSITSNARGASVWVDGTDSGQITPCSVELPLGAHRVRLVGPQGYRPEEKNVFLQDEESMRLEVPLTPELVAIPANNVTPSRPTQRPEYVPPANPNLLVWCGLDYSMAKFIGSARDFPESELFPSSSERRNRLVEPMTSAWNDLFMKEMYPRLGRELGALLQADLHAVEVRNARVGPQQVVDEDSSPANPIDNGGLFNPTRLLRHGNKTLPTHISNADIAAVIRSYRLQTRSGLGLVFIMDRLVKKQETGCMYVVFFDIATRTVVSQERVCTDAGGGGIRNHWFGGVKETVKRLPGMYQDAKSKR